MTVFKEYAEYYDILYRDKNYVEEAVFTNRLIRRYAPQALKLLELGCGTCMHAEHLAQLGYTIQGVDLSSTMLKLAEKRIQTLPDNIKERICVNKGDIRNFELNERFDVIIALFHVLSYQTSNNDLKKTFSTIKKHLKPEGIVIFDCWYGPAVLFNRPQKRTKEITDGEITLSRTAIPNIKPETNCVDVQYFLKVKNNTAAIKELQETHTMRYLFSPEIDLFIEQERLSILEKGEWLTGKPPGFDTWSVYFILKNDD